VGFSAAAGAAGDGAANDGRCPSMGLITRFAGASGAAAGGAAATGFSATGAGGAAGFGGAAGGAATAFGAGGAEASAFFLSSRLATSPGLEIWERSILVLISGSPVRLPPSRAALPPPGPERCLRTRSASSASIELECVFFSVTPTRGRTSRIALLLTSSSLAKSLIRTLLIPPFVFLRKHCFSRSSQPST
jgi:hypothetical protein